MTYKTNMRRTYAVSSKVGIICTKYYKTWLQCDCDLLVAVG